MRESNLQKSRGSLFSYKIKVQLEHTRGVWLLSSVRETSTTSLSRCDQRPSVALMVALISDRNSGDDTDDGDPFPRHIIDRIIGGGNFRRRGRRRDHFSSSSSSPPPWTHLLQLHVTPQDSPTHMLPKRLRTLLKHTRQRSMIRGAVYAVGVGVAGGTQVSDCVCMYVRVCHCLESIHPTID